MADGIEHIIIACGSTDCRKQIEGLSAIVDLKFKLDPCLANSIFLFCNRKRNTIKLLRWDKNGFILATKKVMEEMKFQWPKSPDEILNITYQEYRWLCEGLKINQPKAHRDIQPKQIAY